MLLLAGFTEPEESLSVEGDFFTPSAACSLAPAMLKYLLDVEAEVDAEKPEDNQEKIVRLAFQAAVGRGGDVDDVLEIMQSSRMKPGESKWTMASVEFPFQRFSIHYSRSISHLAL